MVKAEIVEEIDARVSGWKRDMKFLADSGDYQGAATLKVKIATLKSLNDVIKES